MDQLRDYFDQVTETPQEVDDTYKLVLQVMNVGGFLVIFTSGYTGGFYISKIYEWIVQRPDGFYGEDYNGAIEPSGYAFSIWGVIYGGWLAFVAYQALPSEWVPSRNDKLIYNDIGYFMLANMLANASWPIFRQFNNSLFYSIGSFISIVIMLGTALYILYQSSKNSVDWIELIVLRGTFSIYAGWLSAATILATKALFEQAGYRDVNNIYPNEESWGIIILWVAFLIYQTTTEMWRNPLFGAVFTWAITACYDDVTKKGNLPQLQANILAIDSIHTGSLFLYAAYFAYEKWGLGLEEYGLLYKIVPVFYNF